MVLPVFDCGGGEGRGGTDGCSVYGVSITRNLCYRMKILATGVSNDFVDSIATLGYGFGVYTGLDKVVCDLQDKVVPTTTAN